MIFLKKILNHDPYGNPYTCNLFLVNIIILVVTLPKHFLIMGSACLLDLFLQITKRKGFNLLSLSCLENKTIFSFLMYIRIHNKNTIV